MFPISTSARASAWAMSPCPTGVRTEVDLDDAVAIGTLTRSTLEAIAEEEAAEAEAEAEALSGDEGVESVADGDADEASDAE